MCSALYGIVDIGATPKGCQKLISAITTMIREIYKDHPYRTGRSHLDFVRHRGLPTAVDIVLRRLIAHADQLQHRQALNQHPTETVLTVGHTMHPCPDCQAAFSTRKALSVHRMTTHTRSFCSIPFASTKHEMHSWDCLLTLTVIMYFMIGTISSITLKAEHVWFFDASKEIQDDLTRAQLQLRVHIVAETWDDIPQDDTLRSFLSTHCILCQRFVPRTQELTSHVRHHHSDLADRAVQAGRDFMCTRKHDPCAFCLRPRRRQGHLCAAAVNLQLFALHHYGHPFGVPASSLAAAPAHARHLCTYGCLNDLHLWHEHALASAHIPAAPREGNELADYLNALTKGSVLELLHDCTKRMHLSLQCQLCSFSAARPPGLYKHLQCAHGHRWLLANEMAVMMQHSWDGHCICNPAPAARRGHHCVGWEHLSMIYYNYIVHATASSHDHALFGSTGLLATSRPS